MASNKRLLKAYVRFDGSGRIVPSSVIFRKNMPKVGKWKEVQEYLCCNGTELFYTPTLPITTPQVNIYCDEALIEDDTISGTYTTINDLVAALNSDPGGTSQYGFYAPGPSGSIKLTVSPFITCSGVLSMTITD